METALPLVLALWVLRLLMSVLSGYVHPDEYFQNLEVMAADVLGAPGLRVWEFKTSRPIRCIVAPAVSTGLPLALLRAVFGGEMLDGRAIFLCSRLSFLLISFLLDLIVYRVNRRCGLDGRISLLLLGSSWPLLVLQLRPFSNSIESLCLFASFYIVFCSSVKWRPTLFGAVIAVGFFARITFLAFAFPLGLLLLYQTWRSAARNPWSQRVRQCTSVCAQVMFSFILVAFVHIVCDSLYYGSLTLSLASSRVTLHNFFSLVSKPLNWSLIRIKGRWTVTPWNNIVYNSDVSNLSVHGLHPRILHSCVNLPLLFAPALLSFVCTLWYWRRQQKQQKHPAPMPSHLHSQLFWCSAACVVSAVSVLSIFPHQEARFLLPLLAPFSFLAAPFFECNAAGACSTKRCLKMVWLLFNVVLSVLFGHLHQGGVVKTLLATNDLQEFALSSSASTVSSIDLVFCCTYLAPRSLSVSSRTHPALTIHDIEYEELEKTVEQIWSTSAHRMVLIACPASVSVPSQSTTISFELVRSFSPHLSFEALPRSFDELALNIYRVTPMSDNKA